MPRSRTLYQRCLDVSGYKPVWNKTYGETETEYANALVQTSDNGYAISAYTASYSSGGYDFCLVKTDPFGLTD